MGDCCSCCFNVSVSADVYDAATRANNFTDEELEKAVPKMADAVLAKYGKNGKINKKDCAQFQLQMGRVAKKGAIDGL